MEVGDTIALGSGVVAVVAAGVSIWQARIARSSASEQLALAKQIQQEQNEPYVVVDIGPDRPGSSLLVLTIQNTGPTVARDVRIQVTPELTSTHAKLTERLQKAVVRPISHLPPGRTLSYAFDTSQRWERGLPMQFDVTVDARGPAGPVETLKYRIDLDVLAGYLIGERDGKRVEEHLKRIEKHLGALSKAYGEANGGAIRAEEQHWIDEFRSSAAGGDDSAPGA